MKPRNAHGVLCQQSTTGAWYPIDGEGEYTRCEVGSFVIFDFRKPRYMRWVQSLAHAGVIVALIDGKLYRDGEPIDSVSEAQSFGVMLASDNYGGLLSGTSSDKVNARKLHTILGVGRDFSTWLRERCEAVGAVEDEDFGIFPETGENSVGRPKVEWWVTSDMAKHFALMERNEIGRRVRNYFIACEKQLVAAPLAHDFSDPLVAAKLYITAEQERREAVAMIGHKDAELLQLHDDLAAMVDKLEIPNRATNLKQFFKETADVLGFSSVTGYQYLRDAGILKNGQSNKWDKTYVPSAEYDRRGLFSVVQRKYVRPLKRGDEAKGPGEVVELSRPVVLLTPDKLDAAGVVTSIGGYSWLLRKMLRDPRTALGRLVAKEGGPSGIWAPLYGCQLKPSSTEEGLTAQGKPSVIRYYRSDAAFQVSRYNGKTNDRGDGKTLQDALRALLAATPPDAIKALAKT